MSATSVSLVDWFSHCAFDPMSPQEPGSGARDADAESWLQALAEAAHIQGLDTAAIHESTPLRLVKLAG